MPITTEMGVGSESFSTKMKSWDLNSSLLCVKHFMLLLLFSEKCLDFLSWDSRLFMIGTFPTSLTHLLPLLPSASLCLGCKISWVLRALHALTCLQGFAHADSVWNSLLLFLLVILLPIQDWVQYHLPGKHSQISYSFLPAPAVTPGLCPWPLLAGTKALSVYHFQLYLEEQVTPPEENNPASWFGQMDSHTVLCVSREQEHNLPWKCPGVLSGSLVVKNLPSNARSVGLIPSRGAKILHASQPKTNPQNIVQKQ